MDLGGSGDFLKTVIAIATRHPLQRSELRKALEDYFAGDTEKARMKMEEIFASGRFDIVRRGGEVYWIIRQGPDSE
jgi:hypothetical protein